MTTLPQMSSGVAFLALVGAVAWLATTVTSIDDPGRPTTKAESLQFLEASVPTIGPMANFDVNDLNPFIPIDLRDKEKAAGNRPAKPRATPPDPVVPPKELPRISPPTVTGPKLHGIMTSATGEQIFTTLPGDTRPRIMHVGETANGWKLDGIDGPRARFVETATNAVILLNVVQELSLPPIEVKPADPRPAQAAPPPTAPDAQAATQQLPPGMTPGQPPPGMPDWKSLTPDERKLLREEWRKRRSEPSEMGQ